MRVLVFLAFAALVGFSQAASLKKTADCEDGTLCPGGCCPEMNWYCCPDGQYCAATAGDCPFVAAKEKLMKMAAAKRVALAKTADWEDGTLCPGGCCPELNWFCCPDGLYCAATSGDCPFVAAKEKLIKMAAALMDFTVLPLLEIAPLLQQRGNLQKWQHSKVHQGSSHLNQLFLGGNKGAISRSGSTVKSIRAAEPVQLRAATSRAESTILTVSSLGKSNSLGSSHLHQLLLGSNKGTVTRGGSTVLSIRAAVPVHLRATTSGAEGTIFTVLGFSYFLGNSHLDHLFLDVNKGTVTRGGSTVLSIWAAVPVHPRA